MNLYEFAFAAGLVVCLIVTLVKIYNLMKASTFYELPVGFILFLLFLFGWFLTLAINILMVGVVTEAEMRIYSVLFIFNSSFLVLNVLFMITELLFNLGYLASGNVEAYDAQKHAKADRY